MSQTTEDYLKVIYLQTRNVDLTNTTAIAERLAVKPASVTNMLQKLAKMDPPMVIYKKHQGVKLSDEGRKKALRVLRRHRLMEQFLIHYLDYSWEEVHQEAELLEHVMSEKLEKRIANKLGNPEFGLHGGPIPRSDLSMPDNQTKTLLSCPEEKIFQIKYIDSENEDVLRYLQKIKITPGMRIIIIQKPTIDQTIKIFLPDIGETLTIGEILAQKIQVQD